MIRSLAAIAGMVAISATPAHAQTGQRITFGDLDLSTRQGAAVFDQRVREAARTECRPPPPGLIDLTCLHRFRRNALEALPASARSAYAQAPAASPVTIVRRRPAA